jgi:hypothetical protein
METQNVLNWKAQLKADIISIPFQAAGPTKFGAGHESSDRPKGHFKGAAFNSWKFKSGERTWHDTWSGTALKWRSRNRIQGDEIE